MGARRRRIQHAHRIRQPVGSLDGQRAIQLRRRRPTLLGPAGLAVVLAIGAMVAVVVGPWEPLDAGAAAAPTALPPATQAVQPGAGGPDGDEPSLGPHGDGVALPGPSREDVAGPRDAHAGGRAGPPPPELLTGYAWPVRNARITNAYGAGRPGSFLQAGGVFHDGIDVSSFCGARITAAHDGVVLAAGRRAEAFLGWIGDLGPFRAKLDAQGGWGAQAITVVVDDGNGYRSVYAHLGLAVVTPGDVVRSGDLLGFEGASGNATGCHLHYAIYSPRERATLTLDPKLARKTRLPSLEIARIDPLLVLPRPGTAGVTWGWGAR